MDIHNQERRRVVFNSPSTENMLLHELLQEILRVHLTEDATGTITSKRANIKFPRPRVRFNRTFESRYLKLTWIHGQFPESQVGANHDIEDKRNVT